MLSAAARVRRRQSAGRPARARPVVRRGLGKRLAGAVRRRVRHAWSWLTAGNCAAPAEVAFDWLMRYDGAKGVPAAAGETTGCAGATGGAIETALAFGAVETARRWAEWLVSLQRADGSLGSGCLLHTAQAARGLLAIEPEMHDLRAAVLPACRFLANELSKKSPERDPAKTLSVAASLPPLMEAARRFAESGWAATVHGAALRYQETVDPARLGLSTDVRAWWVEALIELGFRDAAVEAVRPAETHQRRDGSVPVRPGAGWVSSADLAHLAVCWYRLGRRDRADRAMRCLARRQRPSGGFPGGWGRGAQGHPRAEAAWTVKHYLDAALLQVQAAFDAHPTPLQTPPTTFFAELPGAAVSVPDRIDPADGRMQAVRRWFEALPGDARVADVGCGRGRYLRHLAAWFPAARLTGIDVSPTMLAGLPWGVKALRGSLLRIPAPDGAFHGAFAVESLEHALLPARAVAELCRVVRPDGRVLIIDKRRAQQPLSEHEPWERWFTPEELTGWLAPHCDQLSVEPVSHLEGRPGGNLFLVATARRRKTQ